MLKRNLLLLAVLVLGAMPARATSVGCTLFANKEPGVDVDGRPRCLSGRAMSCYYCEYSFGKGGGFSICSESADKSETWCVDVRDLPPFQVWSPGWIGEVVSKLASLAACPQTDSSL